MPTIFSKEALGKDRVDGFYDTPLRNEKFFFKEGITCSSVGVRFSAAYLPPGSLFGVNANFFFPDRQTLFYALGLLNTKIAWYFARKVLIRTNNISANYLRLMPFVEAGETIKTQIAETVERLVVNLRHEGKYGFAEEQARLNELFFEIYDLDENSKNEINDFCENFYDRL